MSPTLWMQIKKYRFRGLCFHLEALQPQVAVIPILICFLEPTRYPPESLRVRTFTSKSDVYMFGMTVWEICMFGERPWKNLSSLQVTIKVLDRAPKGKGFLNVSRFICPKILDKIEKNNERLPRPDFCSRKLYELLLSCWVYNANDRPSFQNLSRHLREVRLLIF
jgi:hypothetical protein